MKKNNETIYVSPRVKAVDIKTQAMLCQSGGIKDMVRDEDEGDELS